MPAQKSHIVAMFGLALVVSSAAPLQAHDVPADVRTCPSSSWEPEEFANIRIEARKLMEKTQGASEEQLREIDQRASELISELHRLGYPRAVEMLGGTPRQTPTR